MATYTPIYRCSLVRDGSIATRPRLNSQDKAMAICQAYLADSPAEQLISILLDSKLKVIGITPITVGIINQSLAHAREVFRPAIIANAASVILAHNHPSGDCTLSPADRAVYKQLTKAGKILGIEILDFIVVDGMGGSESVRGPK